MWQKGRLTIPIYYAIICTNGLEDPNESTKNSMKASKFFLIFFSILFIIGILLELPMSAFVLFGSHETFMAVLDVEGKTMAYKFLPIVLNGEKEILTMYFLYVPFPTALSLIGWVCSLNRYQRKY